MASRSAKTMKNRRSHYKSRSGCTNCKKRHVKCDELGPPCANCSARNCADTCTYPNGNPNTKTVTIPRISPQPVPKVTETHSSDHTLELELMHQWSISTYKGLCTSTEDVYCLQVEVPKWALKHEFLRNGMFALSALEIAMTESHRTSNYKSSVYVKAALEYYNKGSSSFRTQLSYVTSENLHCLYLFSGIAVMANLAMIQNPPEWSGEEHKSLLERVSVLLELIYGWSAFALNYLNDLMNGPLATMLKSYMNKLTNAKKTTAPEEDMVKAMDRFSAVVEQLASNSFPAQEVSNISSIEVEDLRRAVQLIRFSLSIPATESVKGSMSASLPILAGKGFSAAVKNSEPAALLVLLYWSVLANSLGSSAWWARSIGSMLVDHIVNFFAEVNPALDQSAVECISWAQERIASMP